MKFNNKLNSYVMFRILSGERKIYTAVLCRKRHIEKKNRNKYKQNVNVTSQ